MEAIEKLITAVCGLGVVVGTALTGLAIVIAILFKGR